MSVWADPSEICEQLGVSRWAEEQAGTAGSLAAEAAHYSGITLCSLWWLYSFLRNDWEKL